MNCSVTWTARITISYSASHMRISKPDFCLPVHRRRSNLYVRDGSLFIKPTLITDRVPDAMVS